MEDCKKQTNRYQLCLFLRGNNVDLKTNSRTYGKSIMNFVGARIAAINLFQVDIYQP